MVSFHNESIFLSLFYSYDWSYAFVKKTWLEVVNCDELMKEVM